MSQRGKRKDPEPSEDASTKECLRLQQLAHDIEVCRRRRKECTQEADLPKFLGSANGKDILKKSSSRKGRYLIHISAKFTPAVAGKLGTLTNLDSKNPVLYFDFPSGRLKLTGTLLFPKNKYLLLKFGTKSALCEEVFDSIVMFSEMQWVGKKEDNPDETPMAIPAELEQPIERDSAKALQGGPAAEGVSPLDKAAGRKRESPLKSQEAPSSTVKLRRAAADRIALSGSSSDEADDIEDADEPPPSVPRDHLRRSSKTAAQRRLQESDDEGVPSGGSSNAEPSETDDNRPKPRKLKLSQQAAANPSSARPASKTPAAKPKPAATSRRNKRALASSSESEDEADEAPEVVSISSGSNDDGGVVESDDEPSNSGEGSDDDFEL